MTVPSATPAIALEVDETVVAAARRELDEAKDAALRWFAADAAGAGSLRAAVERLNSRAAHMLRVADLFATFPAEGAVRGRLDNAVAALRDVAAGLDEIAAGLGRSASEATALAALRAPIADPLGLFSAGAGA